MKPKFVHGIAFLTACVCTTFAQAADPVNYTAQVKPLLQKYCTECHGAEYSESDLRLDTAALGIQGGVRGPSIKPGNSKESLLIQAISGTHKELSMPPDDPLKKQEVALIARWIDEGAKAPKEVASAANDPRSNHWSFQPIQRPQLPPVRDQSWCRTPIDRFILARLEKEGLAPSEDADRSTLLRRVKLDLLGLPPTTAEMEEFLSDKSPDAYEKMVDRLLASPHYGERWGRHWLDLARYGDSNGFTIDSARQIWMYRDWVINALNQNMPFDQFTIEQIAGDMLPDATDSQKIATGFHRNTLRNEEGGTDDEQFRVEAIVDRVNTTGAVFLGLTLGCAQCHDHKFDPISQRDYYSMYAFLNNCSEPNIKFPTKEQKEKTRQFRAAQEKTQNALNAYEAEQQPKWQKNILLNRKADWKPLSLKNITATKKAEFTVNKDFSVLVNAKTVDKDATYEISTQLPVSGVTALRLETLTDKNLPRNGPGTASNGNFVLREFQVFLQSDDGTLQSVKVSKAKASHAQSKHAADGMIDGDLETGWAVNDGRLGINIDHTAIFHFEKPITAPTGSRLVIKMIHAPATVSYNIGRFRLSVTAARQIPAPASEKLVTACERPDSERSDQQKHLVTHSFRDNDSTYIKLYNKYYDEIRNEKAIQKQTPSTLVLRELSKPRDTYIHIRGDFLRHGKRVYPEVPEVLPGLNVPSADKANRLDLARWLVHKENPLTPRVTVNRFWQRLFGLGIVATENDFGLQGKKPTHPKLLDWLASEFVRTEWNIKEIHKLIVTSSVYRQASTRRADLTKKDPRNKLLGKQSRIRLQAETIRDTALAASDLLSRKIGGPSVYPPQPKGLDAFTQNKKGWTVSKGDDRYRRGMYTFFWRSSPHPFLMTFDAPDGNGACTRRVRSNTPLQALTLANDITFVEAAQALAREALQLDTQDPKARIEYMFRSCLTRTPSEEEYQLLIDYLSLQQEQYEKHPKEAELFASAQRPKDQSAADTASWTAVARVILNLDEFITRE